MLSHAELYERLYLNGWTKEQQEEARWQLIHMSDIEWSDWIEYRNAREGRQGI